MVNLINMKEMLTNAQKTLIGKAFKVGRIVLKPTKRQIHGGFLGTLAAIGIPMAIELASKYLEADCKLLEKLGEKDCKLLEKLELACRFRRSLFYGNLPPSMVHGRGRDAERREKDFCWGTTAHSTTSPSWEQFFKRSSGCFASKAKMERYSPVKF